jgi:phospholipid/cholesterol/gamma-HCH transport system substrate-binding protein
MTNRREQVLVGTFVLVAAVVLIGVVISVSGAFAAKGNAHRAYFKYAAGMAPGTPIRYGGLMAGRITAVRVDPEDSTRIEFDLEVLPGIPVKTDSLAKISSLGALGDNYLEITTGTKGAPLAPPGSVIQSKETMALSDIGDMIGGLMPGADRLLNGLNDRVGEMKLTLSQVNDLLGESNRKNVAKTLDTLNGMLAENRPTLKATLDNVHESTEKLPPIMTNVQTASDKIAPLLDDLKGTIKQANDALAHIDGVILENRPDIKAVMGQIQKTLGSASDTVDLLQATLDRNSDNIDDLLVNLRETMVNMNELTDALKRNPSLLIRGETAKDRKPGGTK